MYAELTVEEQANTLPNQVRVVEYTMLGIQV